MKLAYSRILLSAHYPGSILLSQLFVFLVLLSLLGCSSMGGSNSKSFEFPGKRLDSARGVAGRFLESLRDEDYRRALEYCSPELFRKVSRENLKERFASLSSEVGIPCEYREMNHKSEAFGETPKRDRVELRYEVTHARGRSVQTFILESSPTSRVFEIVEWRIDQAEKGARTNTTPAP